MKKNDWGHWRRSSWTRTCPPLLCRFGQSCCYAVICSATGNSTLRKLAHKPRSSAQRPIATPIADAPLLIRGRQKGTHRHAKDELAPNKGALCSLAERLPATTHTHRRAGTQTRTSRRLRCRSRSHLRGEQPPCPPTAPDVDWRMQSGFRAWREFMAPKNTNNNTLQGTRIKQAARCTKERKPDRYT